MSFYVPLPIIMGVLAGAICAVGYMLGRHLLTKQAWNETAEDCSQYYRSLYNEQMGELCVRYRQERAALATRYSELTQELEHEIQVLRRAIDPERTVRSTVSSNMEAVELDREVV